LASLSIGDKSSIWIGSGLPINPSQRALLESPLMIRRGRALSVPELLLVMCLLITTLASGQTKKDQTKTYPLSTWSNMTCRAKGRFQDREYCSSAVIDRIVADGKSAIPVLIAQITDSRWIAEPVYDFWPRIRAGDLAYFILENLFVDETWQHSTMPALFPSENCAEPAWVCWESFRKRHNLEEIQARWTAFWEANKERIYWDAKARCFRLARLGRSQ